MAEHARIPLQNEVEAQLVASLLKEDGIPHFVRSYHDSAYDGLYQTELGWGHVEVPPDREAEVTRIVDGIRAGQAGP
jgi:hypothetical protein